MSSSSLHPEPLVGLPCRHGPLAAGAARIEVEDDEPLARQCLIPEPAAHPAVAGHGRVGSAVGHEPDGVLLPGVQVGGQDQLALQQEAVAGGDLDALARPEPILLEPVHGVGIHGPHELAVGE